MKLSRERLHVLAQALRSIPEAGGSATAGEVIIWAAMVMALGHDLILRVSWGTSFSGEVWSTPAALVVRGAAACLLCWFLYRGDLWARVAISASFGLLAVVAAAGVLESADYHSGARGGFGFFLVALYAWFMLLLCSRHVDASLAARAGQTGPPDALVGPEHRGGAQTPKKCPNCRLLNPRTAHRCDCGHDFCGEAEGPP